MRIIDHVQCIDFPCVEARQESYLIPDLDLDPTKVRIMLISETAPTEAKDYYYAGCEALFARTTIQAFQEAGVKVKSIQELLDMGVYMTTAVKCGKNGYSVATSTTVRCSALLEHEVALFPNVKAYLLMGDVAIRAVNQIARRAGAGRVIPAGSTYKIRKGEYFYRQFRVFPSYLQTGKSYLIEKSKRKMIAEDIKTALAWH